MDEDDLLLQKQERQPSDSQLSRCTRLET